MIGQNSLELEATRFIENVTSLALSCLGRKELNRFQIRLGSQLVTIWLPNGSKQSDIIRCAFISEETVESSGWNLIVWDCNLGLDFPEITWDFRLFEPTGQLYLDSSDNQILLEPTNGVLWVLNSREKLVVCNLANLAKIPLWWCATPFRIGLNWIANFDDSDLVHGAALSMLDKSVILAGPSGSGKSTMCFRLQTKGWSIIADDFFLIKNNFAQAIYSRLKLTQESLDLLDAEISVEYITNADKPKLVINAGNFTQEGYALNAAISHVAFPMLEEFTGLRSISAKDAFIRFVPPTLAGLQGGLRTNYSRLSKVLGTLDTAKLGAIGPIDTIDRDLQTWIGGRALAKH